MMVESLFTSGALGAGPCVVASTVSRSRGCRAPPSPSASAPRARDRSRRRGAAAHDGWQKPSRSPEALALAEARAAHEVQQVAVDVAAVDEALRRRRAVAALAHHLGPALAERHRVAPVEDEERS
eukprot:scaffold3940_cov43-Phaeocystis_antarctica.AAC.2